MSKPGARRAARTGKLEQHPLGNPGQLLGPGARVGRAKDWRAEGLGGDQKYPGQGDPFFGCGRKSDLYQPAKPAHRRPPPKVKKKSQQPRIDDEAYLRECAENGEVEEVQLLLDAGVDMDAQSWAGWTALHYAAACGHYAVAELLLERKCNTEIAVVLTGQTPYMLACAMGQPGIVELLVANGVEQEVVDERMRDGRALAVHSSVPGTAAVVELVDKLAELGEGEADAEELAA